MLLRHVGPPTDLIDHPVDEQGIDFFRIRPQAGIFVLRQSNRVGARVCNGFLDRPQFRFGQVISGSSRQAGLIAAVLLADDWGDRLRCEVTADQEDVGIVSRHVYQFFAFPSAFNICISWTTTFPSSLKTYVDGMARCLCSPGVSSPMYFQIFSSGASNTPSSRIWTMFNPPFRVLSRDATV